MDGDSSQKEAIHRNHGAYDSNLFQSSWFRRLVQTSNGLDKFLLDYGFNFLPGLSILFWFVFLFAKM
jgi:hypothetical protein